MANLTITNPSLKTGEVLRFTFSGFLPKISLNIVDDGSGLGFVEVTANGIDIGGNSQVAIGTAIVIHAWVYNDSIAKFNGWLDPQQVLNQNWLMSPVPLPNPLIVNSGGWRLTATFARITPPPTGGPIFPAPGRMGDGDVWYWVRFADGSIGWDDAQDLYYNQSGYTILAGPYASGATG